MNDVMMYLWLLVFGFVGLFMLMMVSSRHQKKFAIKLPLPMVQKIAIAILVVSVLPVFWVSHTVYFVMAWCLLLSLSAGVIYVGLMYDEWRKNR